MVTIKTLQMKEAVKRSLLDLEGVTGVGAGSGSGDFINVYVREMTAEIRAKIPSEIDGIPTRIIVTGEIGALQMSGFENLGELPALAPGRTEKSRPAFPGQSIGQVNVTAGTFGFVGVDSVTRRRVIVSNSHVLVADPREPIMADPSVVQPGIADGGIPANDKIGETSRWVTLSTTADNVVDCAMAIPTSDADVSDEILEIGAIMGVATASVDMKVMKSGRSSGLTEGTVIDVNADIKVGYKDFSATFTDQILTSSMAIPGDSGSLLLDNNNNAVGLVFAGSDKVSCCNKIGTVLGSLGITIPGFYPPVPPTVGFASLLIIPAIVGGAYYLLRGRM